MVVSFTVPDHRMVGVRDDGEFKTFAQENIDMLV